MIQYSSALYFVLWAFAIVLVSRSVEPPRTEVPVKIVKVKTVSP